MIGTIKVRALEMEATKDELRQMLRDENQALLQQVKSSHAACYVEETCRF